MQSDPANPTPPGWSSGATTLRTKLFLLGSLVLAGIALLSGMASEWIVSEPVGTVLAIVAFVGSLALGIAFARSTQVGSSEHTADPVSVGGDGRPVLVLIWWPIVVVSIGVAILMAIVAALNGVSVGSGLPTAICLVLGVFGFISLPIVLRETRAQFRGRGVRGFWRAFRSTEWGDGGI